jgi:predicted transcriptional regulator
VIGIKIISATPGPDTTEEILTLVQAQSTGITTKEIARSLNRPISMIQICLKNLISSKDIFARKNKTGSGLIYYPRKPQKI